jgi:hypothetical protein
VRWFDSGRGHPSCAGFAAGAEDARSPPLRETGAGRLVSVRMGWIFRC